MSSLTLKSAHIGPEPPNTNPFKPFKAPEPVGFERSPERLKSLNPTVTSKVPARFRVRLFGSKVWGMI